MLSEPSQQALVYPAGVLTHFHAIVDLPAAEQHARLDAIAMRDAQLAAALRSLLRVDESFGEGAEPELSGLSFDGYRVIRHLGSGGMGTVFLAERVGIGGWVALKVLRDPSQRLPFGLEQHVHARMSHPCIASYYGYGTTPDGLPYFALEYVEGASLTAHCSQREIDLMARLRLFRDTCLAVGHAHGRGVIHRDLKPSNVLVRRDGTPCLLDFGIATPVSLPTATEGRGQWGRAALTPAYAAPEQHRGESACATTDVYALGVILFELVAGVHPFELDGKTPAEVSRCVQQGRALPPSRAVRSAPESHPVAAGMAPSQWRDLDRLVDKAMAVDPEQRYSSVEALIRDLDHFVRGEPLDAHEPSFAYRATKFVRRHRVAVVAGGLTFFVLLASSLFYVWDLARSRRWAQDEARRATRVQQFMGTLLSGDDPAGPRQGLTVAQLMQQALRELPSADLQPLERAEVLTTVGASLAQIGRYDDALAPLQRALRLHEREQGWHSVGVARVLVELASLRLARGEADAALRDARWGMGVVVGQRRADEALFPRALGTLGDVLNARGDYAEAVRILESHAERLVGDEPAWATPRDALALAHFYLGNYGRAEDWMRMALRFDRRRLGANHPHVGHDLLSLSSVATQRGEHARAASLTAQALAIFEGHHGLRHPEVASALTIHARALVEVGRPEPAREALRRALEICQELYGEKHPRTASALNALFLLAMDGDQLEEARRLAQRVLEIERAVHGDRHFRVGVALANLASVALRQGRGADAEGLLRQALDVYDLALPANHLNVAIARVRLGTSLGQQKRFEAAVEETRAGLRILQAQTPPPPQWVEPTLRQLAEALEALGRTAEAVEVRERLSPRKP